MRIPKIFWNYFSFLSAAVISVIMATMAVNFIEKTSRDQIEKQLLTGGVDWVDVETIGLQVFLIGDAPDEADDDETGCDIANNVGCGHVDDADANNTIYTNHRMPHNNCA